jgi:hypothetical protein
MGGGGRAVGVALGKTVLTFVFKGKIIKKISSRSNAPEEFKFT